MIVLFAEDDGTVQNRLDMRGVEITGKVIGEVEMRIAEFAKRVRCEWCNEYVPKGQLSRVDSDLWLCDTCKHDYQQRNKKGS